MVVGLRQPRGVAGPGRRPETTAVAQRAEGEDDGRLAPAASRPDRRAGTARSASGFTTIAVAVEVDHQELAAASDGGDGLAHEPIQLCRRAADRKRSRGAHGLDRTPAKGGIEGLGDDRSDRVVRARQRDCSRVKPCARLSRPRRGTIAEERNQATAEREGADRGVRSPRTHPTLPGHGLSDAQAVRDSSGANPPPGVTTTLTEEQQGGTAPDTDANASVTPQASEQPVGAVAVADEPAEANSSPEIEGTAEAADSSEPSAEAAALETSPADAATEEAPVEASAPADTELAADTAEATDGSATPADVEAPAAEAAPAVAETADWIRRSGRRRDGHRHGRRRSSPWRPMRPPTLPMPRPRQPPTPARAIRPMRPRPEATDGLDAADTADAPAADDEPEPVAPPRDLGPEPTTMEELLAEQDSDIKSFKHGDVVEGNVVRIDKDEILVDIGAKSEGVVSNRELFGRHGGEGQAPLNIGDTVLVYVLQPESPEGHAVLSLRRAGLERKWRAMQEQFEAGVIIEAPVIDHNKGGLIVDCGIRGFVPISQIVDFPRRPQNDQPRDAAQEIAEKLKPFVGRKLRLKILEVNRKANRLILSEKVALYEERREKRDELFSSLQVGQKVTGTVRSIAPFGVFIDLGGIDGLVHKSELSWNKVNNPESGYKVGDEVEAEVIDINHERGRISLSIRRLQPDPWHSTVADFNVGDVIDGTVTKLVNFGAFVRVRDGLEGLIHISELSHQRVAHPGDVVHEGQSLKLKIISLDSERHRLGLSLKQAEEPPARPAPEPGQPGPTAQRPAREPSAGRARSAATR